MYSAPPAAWMRAAAIFAVVRITRAKNYLNSHKAAPLENILRIITTDDHKK